MGRQAKIRQQRQKDEPSFVSKKQVQESSLWSEFIKMPAPKISEENPSFWKKMGKIVERFNPLPKVDLDKYQPCFDALDFFQENQVVLGAIAWEGYHKNGEPGIVFVQILEDKPPIVEYISRKNCRQKLRQYVTDSEEIKDIVDMIKISKPKEKFIMIYINSQGEMTLSLEKPEPAPPECYEIMSQQRENNSALPNLVC
jgi:hypothetical protein